MRCVLFIIVLSGFIALAARVRGQTTGTSSLEGVVTLVDVQRKLIVIQNGNQAQAIRIEGEMPHVQFGEQISMEGRFAPYYGAFPDYPAHPAGQTILPAFEAPTDWNDHFIARLRGFLRVPADGDYTFWVMADEEGDLFLGTNSDPGTARLIATAPRGLGPAAWDNSPQQKSQPIHLKAGERYYIEARQREWRGHDLLTVAWQRPASERQIIGGEFLSPWRMDSGKTNGILYEYWTNCFLTQLASLSPEPQVWGVNDVRVRSLGPGQLPDTRRVSPRGDFSDVGNFAWVEVEGTVSFAAVDGNVLTLELKESKNRNSVAGGQMIVHVLNWADQSAARWLNCKVRARGVYERVLNASGPSLSEILWVQDDHQLSRLGIADSDSRDLEALPMFEITPGNLKLAWGRKVLVSGTVMSCDEKTGRVLLRGEDSFYAYSSTNGETWTPFGAPIPVSMEDSILTGLAATSLTATQAMRATFSQISPDLNRGRTVEIGGGPLAGDVTISNGTASLWPAGNRDWETVDGGVFVCKPLQGEGEIVARIDAFNPTRNSDKAGLMMRESLQGDAPFVALVMAHGSWLELIYRRSPESVARILQYEAHEVPGWLKLVRRRHTLVAQLMNGEASLLNEQVELVGLLNWTNGEPLLADAYVRPAESAPEPTPATGFAQPIQIADLPATAAESDQYLNQEYLLRGVVTFKGRAFDREYLFLQDESGAASLRVGPQIFRMKDIEPGCLLEAAGGVSFSPGVPPFRVSTATILGSAVMPRPMPYPDQSAELADNYWVEAKGIVRSVENNVLNVIGRNGLLLVWVGESGNSIALAHYVDCRVTVRGVFSLEAASKPALLVPSPRYIEVTESAPDDPFVIPSHPISKVGASHLSASLQHRVKITGAVTYHEKDMLVVQDHSGGARVFGGQTDNIRVGDRVEVVGFPSQEAEAVTLNEAMVRKIGDAYSPEPIKMMMEGLLDGRLNCWLVRLEGIVLGQKTRQGQQLLELQNGQRVFQALLAKGAGQLRPMRVGSRVQVTGVTQLQVVSHAPATATGSDSPIIATMDVLMRTPDDLVLLERPPWWNWRHTATVGAVLVVILIAAFGWIRSLRRRVAKRTNELENAMSRLQKETELSATLAERERLAAEIHDTLEQGLSGIMMQLDGADTRLANDNSGARENLEMARSMVKFSRAEVRHSLWNLESQLLKDGDLGGAIREIARQMSAGSSTTVSVEVSDTRFDLPAAIAHHLLRCTQEAISNALKHAGARHIRAKLNYSADQVEMEIVDDGRGFDPSQVLTGPGTHLGLRNLRSRARKMKGRLDIASEPHKGTTVRLTVPVNRLIGTTPEAAQ